MKTTLTLTTGLAALALSAPAFAHGDAHSHGFVSHMMHWMSSPVHGLLTLAAVTVAGVVAVKFLRKKA